MTTYKLIPGFPDYRAGSDGSIWSRRGKRSLGRYGTESATLSTWHRLKPSIKTLYEYVEVQPGNKTVAVHRLVLIAFVGPCPDGMVACHNDGNHRNNTPDNLRWGTPASNHADTLKHGRRVCGERNPQAKLTNIQVQQIRQKANLGVTRKELCALYGVSKSLIQQIVTRTIWKELTDAKSENT